MCDYVHCTRRRQRDMLLARQHLHHLHQYHMKGNPVGNGSVGGRVDQLHTASRSTSTMPVRNQSMLTAASVVVAQNQLDNVRPTSGSKDKQRQTEQDRTTTTTTNNNNNNNNNVSSSSERLQRRSHANGNVFYVSGRAHTAPCCTTVNDHADHNATTTFKYFTYDRDYFRERQKSSCLHDRHLRHSMH